jgi:hypothetical protein
MKYLKLSMVFAVFAVTVLGAAAAHAEILLYLTTFPNKFTSSSGEAKFAALGEGLEIKCTLAEGEGEIINGTEGKLTKELFLGCKGVFGGVSVGECKTLAPGVAGDIQVAGTSKLGFSLGTTTGNLEPLVALTLKESYHIECALSNLVVVGGCLLLKPTLAKSLTPTLTAATTGTPGDQLFTDYQTKEGGEMKECKLESARNEATETMSSQAQTATLKFATEVELDD